MASGAPPRYDRCWDRRHSRQAHWRFELHARGLRPRGCGGEWIAEAHGNECWGVEKELGPRERGEARKKREGRKGMGREENGKPPRRFGCLDSRSLCLCLRRPTRSQNFLRSFQDFLRQSDAILAHLQRPCLEPKWAHEMMGEKKAKEGEGSRDVCPCPARSVPPPRPLRRRHLQRIVFLPAGLLQSLRPLPLSRPIPAPPPRPPPPPHTYRYSSLHPRHTRAEQDLSDSEDLPDGEGGKGGHLLLPHSLSYVRKREAAKRERIGREKGLLGVCCWLLDLSEIDVDGELPADPRGYLICSC